MDVDSDEFEAEIKAQVEEWSTNSTECFTIDIKGDGTTAATFQPEFTYPIFGEEEAIFGYQGLSINLAFAAHNLRPHLSIKYKSKFTAQGEVRPTDILELLRDFLPDVAFSSASTEEALRDDEASDFTPPGEKVHEYARAGQMYEIWCANLSEPAAKQLLENMQVLVPLFIEGGTMLQLEQDWTTQRWKLFLLYHVEPRTGEGPTYSPYSLVGYGTSYRVFTFPDRENPLHSDLDLFAPSSQSLLDFLPPPNTLPNDLAQTSMPNNITSPLDLPSRERLSQFLILPPFHRSGHGHQLYDTMYTHLTRPPNVKEFTVEDPNEAFDDLRDFSDLLHLRAHVPAFAALRINTDIPASNLEPTTNIPTDLIVPLSTREKISRQTKLDQRQFDRLVEMHTLSFIPALHRSRSRITRQEKASNAHDRAYFFWRLYAKQRLYLFNQDKLAQVERAERVEKLEAGLDSVLEAYGKMVERVGAREAVGGWDGGLQAGDANANANSNATPRKRVSKRKIVDEDEDEDDEEEGGAEEADDGGESVVAVNGHKKVRVE